MGKRLPAQRLALGNLIFVVRKAQINAARVDINGLAQVPAGHGRTLDVPARAPLAPRRIPAGLTGLGRLPQREVHRVFLVLGHVDAGAGFQLFQRLVRQLAVLFKGAGAVIHVAAALIGVPLFHKAADNVDNLADVLRCTGMNSGRMNTQSPGVGEILFDIAVGNDVVRHALFIGFFDDLVVNVGKVLDKGDFHAAVFQIAPQNVKNNKRACVADVKEIVNRRAAGIHFDLSQLDRDELFFFSRQGVVDFHALFLLCGNAVAHDGKIIANVNDARNDRGQCHGPGAHRDHPVKQPVKSGQKQQNTNHVGKSLDFSPD